MRTTRRKRHVAAIHSPTKGVATYRTAQNAFVFHAHWSADPLKADPEDGSPGWADMVASEEPGGRLSVYFLQEFEADDEAKTGERIYWAFSPERNVIPWRAIPRDWPVHLGADFGQRAATAIMFNAQDPKTKKIYVFDSIYGPKGLDPQVKEEVYRKLSKHFDVPMKQMMIEGAHRYIQSARGDKTGASFIAFYQMDPWPINFAIPDEESVHRNRSTEAKVNRALWPSMTCCGVRHMADKVAETDDVPEDVKKCPLCGKESPVEPILYILEGASPELAEQLENLSDKESAYDGIEAPERESGAPNHAADGQKYIIRTLEWEDAAGPSEKAQEQMSMARLEQKPPYERTIEESMILRAYRAQQIDEMAREQRGRSRTVTASRFGSGRGIVFSAPPRPRPKVMA